MLENQNNPEGQGQNQGDQNQNLKDGSKMQDDELLFNDEDNADTDGDMHDTLTSGPDDQPSVNQNRMGTSQDYGKRDQTGTENMQGYGGSQSQSGVENQPGIAGDSYPDEDSGMRNSMGETSHNDMDDDDLEDNDEGQSLI